MLYLNIIQNNCLVCVSGEDEMDDVPLFIRLNRRRTTKTREKSRSSEEIKHVESNVESSRKGTGSQSVGAKSQAYDIHTKRNKVYVYFPCDTLWWFACGFSDCDVFLQFECIVTGTCISTYDVFSRELKSSVCD